MVKKMVNIMFLKYLNVSTLTILKPLANKKVRFLNNFKMLGLFKNIGYPLTFRVYSKLWFRQLSFNFKIKIKCILKSTKCV